jgi:hypothetical protein
MKKYNILVFPCGSEIGLEIYRSLNGLKEFHLIGASSVSDHGKFCYKNYYDGLEFINDPRCIEKLASIVQKEQIDAIYPATDLSIEILKKNEEVLGCSVISSNCFTTDLCLSKEKTYNHLNNIVKTPYVFDGEIINYPIFAKPKVGYGSRGAKKITSNEALREHLNEFTDCIITEFLPGEEYTVDCFTDFKGNLKFLMPRERSRIMNGISVSTKKYLSDKGEFEIMGKAINSAIEFNGAWFFQVKRNSLGDLVLLEIASRFGGSSSLWKAIGVNLPLLSVFNNFNIEVKFLENNYYVEMDRALNNSFFIDINYDHLYIDFDDCILFGEKINLDAIKLIHQSINNNIKVHLITRSISDNLSGLLKNLRILDLFDTISQLKSDENKSNFILFTNSIFIDDSFAERLEVNKKLNIPTFGPESISCLINE